MHSDDAALGVKKILENCERTNIINLGSGKIVHMRKFVKNYWDIINKRKKNVIFQNHLKSDLRK